MSCPAHYLTLATVSPWAPFNCHFQRLSLVFIPLMVQGNGVEDGSGVLSDASLLELFWCFPVIRLWIWRKWVEAKCHVRTSYQGAHQQCDLWLLMGPRTPQWGSVSGFSTTKWCLSPPFSTVLLGRESHRQPTLKEGCSALLPLGKNIYNICRY